MKHLFNRHVPLVLLLLTFSGVWGQEGTYFTLEDFLLQGPVKQCVVRANYGKETFAFDRLGRLLKTRTEYNDKDYDITFYKYSDSLLTERRDEVYREGRFDPATSMAHIYQRDTTENKKTEWIVSYDKSYTEQLEQYYNASGQLVREVRVDEDGTDETLVDYSTYEGETTATYTRNGNLVKSIRYSRKTEGESPREVELTKYYQDGEPQRAIETIKNTDGQVLKETRFMYETDKTSFVPAETVEWTYDPSGFPLSKTRKTRDSKGALSLVKTQEYIYQMDGSDPPNWVRQITVPENTFVVRGITYYEPQMETPAADSLRN